MGFSWDTTDLGNTLNAQDLTNGFDSFENFVNEGIGRAELANRVPYRGSNSDPFKQQGWLESSRIYRPEFFGSPSPRMMAVSGQTHFRETPWAWDKSAAFNPNVSGSGYVGIPGCTTTIKLRKKSAVNVMSSFYCFEWGGASSPHGLSSATGGYENKHAGYVGLFVSGVRRSETQRQIFTSMVAPWKQATDYFDVYSGKVAANGFLFHSMIGRHQHSITSQHILEPGIHDIGLKFKPAYQQGYQRWFRQYGFSDSFAQEHYGLTYAEIPTFTRNKYVFFQARNFIVDAYYIE